MTERPEVGIQHESGMHPRAVGAAGEIGLFQILPLTGWLVAEGLKMDFKMPTPAPRGSPIRYSDLGTLAYPRANATIAAEYLKQQVDRFGAASPAVVLRAYNRNPDRAREHWPADRYAERVAVNYLTIVAGGRL